MVIQLPGSVDESLTAEQLTPKEIVRELDKYIVGQRAAKRAVAIALRNRWRRQQLPPEMREEIAPKNIIMIGPTGVGKTEIARRLARLTRSPFLKIEASKFTEVGYVVKDKDGRRNRYRVQTHLPLPETVAQERPIGEVLEVLLNQRQDKSDR